jgi:heme A synthase
VVVLHAFLALAAGFGVLTLVTAAFAWMRGRIAPEWADPGASSTLSYRCVTLGCSFLASAAGGYVTAWIGEANPLMYALVLGMIVLVLSALSSLQQRGKQPVSYLLAMVALSPLGVLAGGLVRLRVEGIL